MKRKPVKDRCCLNLDCALHGQFGKGNIIRHSFYKTSQGRFLITTDGYEPYSWAVASMLSLVCVYAQVIKTRRKDRVIKVERKLISGTKEQLEEALFRSEDSWTINTSFIERQNLTIRRGNSYLQRKTISHAREPGHLDGSMALQMCHYNFIRPHLALKFGKESRTPAMQAGIASCKLTFRDIFTSREDLFLCLLIWMLIQHQKVIRRA
ncbi:hypothetical protein ACFLU6_14360 [Acidobacteriota bacterium]